MRIAIVGTGISGLVCAHTLSQVHEVTVFEAEPRPGGHTHTVTVTVDGNQMAVDTGFLVYNELTYPGLTRIFRNLRVATQRTDMSFSVSDARSGLEYGGPSVDALFAQRRNVARPAFLRMLADVASFHRMGRRLLRNEPGSGITVAELAARCGWSDSFVDWYLVPLGSSLWSADPRTFPQMPATTLLRFFDRHGMLGFGGKPSWRTVTGGGSTYVDAILAPMAASGRVHLAVPVDQIVRTDRQVELRLGSRLRRFDHVILATHSDQALGLLADASPAEKEILGSIRYQPNDLTLHTDTRMLPRLRRAWASWNYHRPSTPTDRVTVTYHLNRLQRLPVTTPVLVTLNRDGEIDPALVLHRSRVAHPVFDAAAVSAQGRHGEISNLRRTSFCGAYWGHGFHEDGVQSALRVCRALGVAR